MNEKILKHYIANIAAEIRRLRKQSKLTQVEFAKRAGVGLRFFRELEGGKTTVRADKLMRVLHFLGYHLDIKKNDPTIEQKIRDGLDEHSFNDHA